jgi:two-component system nitrogen regulation response regulator NtrX
MSGRVLIVDDEPNIRKTLEMIHKNAGWKAASAEDGSVALELLEAGAFDLVYLDLSMPGSDGMEVLQQIRLRWPEQLVVILTGQATIERAVEATRLGAFDFLEKDCGKDRILLTSKNALDFCTLNEENKNLKARYARFSSQRQFRGQSRAAVDVMKQVAMVAPTNARVLILGESGTGKELVAQAIHDRGERTDGPFIKVNCAAIPEELIESELFGSVRGAYTGAHESRRGKFEAAHGGTLFLDEIGDMSLKVQTKVLRALQEGEIEKVGSNEVTRVDVRVIAATNKDLAAEVSGGRFREDLYFRINVVPIHVAPLRDRGSDIELLARAFLEEHCVENGVPPKRLDDEVIEYLNRYPWPGNVRELRNQVERMVIMCPGETVGVECLSAEVRHGVPSIARAGGSAAAGDYRGMALLEARKRFERDMIVEALERNGWNVSRAADELGLERTNLHKKMKLLGVNRKEGAVDKELRCIVTTRKYCIATLFILVTFTWAVTSWAQVEGRDNGFYLGIKFIGSSLHIDDDDNDAFFVKDDGGGLQLLAGYSFNDVFSLELDLVGLNHDTSDPAVDAKFAGVRIFAHYRFATGNAFRPYIKGGVGGYALALDGTGIDARIDGGGIPLGGGFDYFFSPHFSLGADFTHNIIEYKELTIPFEDGELSFDIDEEGAMSSIGLALAYYF